MTPTRIDWIAIRAVLARVMVLGMLALPLVLAACGPDNNSGGGGPGSGY